MYDLEKEVNMEGNNGTNQNSLFIETIIASTQLCVKHNDHTVVVGVLHKVLHDSPLLNEKDFFDAMLKYRHILQWISIKHDKVRQFSRLKGSDLIH